MQPESACHRTSILRCLIFFTYWILDISMKSDYNKVRFHTQEAGKMIRQREELKKFNHIYHEMDEVYHNAALQRGLSDSAFSILYAICEYGDGCRQKDISRIFCLSKQTIHSSICKLEREGYLTFRSGKGHSRHIYLTDAGRQLVEEKIWPLIQAENEVFDLMGEEKSRELLRLSEKYMELFRAKVNGPDSPAAHPDEK